MLSFAGLALYASSSDAEGPIPIVVSEETTLITEPLADDGLPDYTAVHLHSVGRGVAPEDNGAIPFWQAAGSWIFDEDKKTLLFNELECDPPSNDGALTWAPAVLGQKVEFGSPVLTVLASRPWDPEQAPDLARWIEESDAALSLGRVAAGKKLFYSPSPSSLQQPPMPIMGGYLYDTEVMRRLAYTLALDAMYRLDRGDRTEVTADVRALQQVARHWFKSGEAFAAVDAGTYARMADRITLLRISRVHELGVARRVCEAVRCQEHAVADWGARYGRRETLGMLDAVVREFSDRTPVEAMSPDGDMKGRDTFQAYWRSGLFDPNATLELLISYWKDLEKIASMTPLDRRYAWLEFGERIEQIDVAAVKVKAMVDGDPETVANGKTVGVVLLMNLLPDALSIFNAVDAASASQRLTQTAAAIQYHQIKHGEYPGSLRVLTPDPLEALPLDPFSYEPFRYERRGDGFALWSVGPNGVDDGASDSTGEFVDGDYAPIDWFNEREPPDGPDDIVVRFPIPPLKLPVSP